jgi:Asp/Glu/hydantoin racemase
MHGQHNIDKKDEYVQSKELVVFKLTDNNPRTTDLCLISCFSDRAS